MTAQEYMMMRRPVEQQLDARNVLNALGAAYKTPQTSYFGLTPENVMAGAQLQAQRQKEMGNMISGAQEAGRAQDAQQYADAMKAQQIQFAEQELRMKQALQALQMQKMRQDMAQAGMGNALNQLKMKAAQQELASSGMTFPVTIGGKTYNMTPAQMKSMGIKLTPDDQIGKGVKNPSAAWQKYNDELSKFSNDPEADRQRLLQLDRLNKDVAKAKLKDVDKWMEDNDDPYPVERGQNIANTYMKSVFDLLSPESKEKYAPIFGLPYTPPPPIAAPADVGGSGTLGKETIDHQMVDDFLKGWQEQQLRRLQERKAPVKIEQNPFGAW